MADKSTRFRTYINHRTRQMMTTIAVASTLVLVALVACEDNQPPDRPTVRDLREASTISERTELHIGVNVDIPLMSYRRNNAYHGFDIEIARYIADSLGFGDQSIRWVPLDTEDRIEKLRSGEVDIVVASFSITEEREKRVGFAGPYLITTPEVLVATEYINEITTITDLNSAEYTVCVAGGSTTEAMLRERGIPHQQADNPAACRDGILAGDFQAMVSDETILAGLRSENPDELAIVDMPFGVEEELGIGVPVEDENLRDLVSYFLDKSYQRDQRDEANAWETAYNNHLGQWLGEASQPRPDGAPDLVDHDDKNRR
ncbi:transporter substrate-binding domain-containing protein [Micromonospora sp. LOL_015]|uniref:transporter substrate-binding domain-containing protein n=1 Tax=Micromonospora sp. LOL_015 TaxID=3345416 RepID=UPI003A88F1E3